MLHSRQRPPRGRKPSANVSSREDPFRPESIAYTERHAPHVTELAGGLVRVDIGEPVKRLPSEPQAVPVGAPNAPPPVFPGAPSVAPAAATAAPAEAPKVTRKEHRPITREP
jgi:hypothetical protein